MQNSFLCDKRFDKALELFNSNQWYKAHDVLEDIWHETGGRERKLLQGILQIAVAEVHLSNNNLNGALILYGESLGRLKEFLSIDSGLNLKDLCYCVESRLVSLQEGKHPVNLLIPHLKKI